MPYNHIHRGRKGIGQNIITLHDKILASLDTEETNMNIIKEITASSRRVLFLIERKSKYFLLNKTRMSSHLLNTVLDVFAISRQLKKI